MATSDTLAFNPSVSQCIEDAYERCNVQLTSGLSLKTALFSLNILLSEWGNRGIHFWEVANASIYINDGQASYDIYWDNTVRNSSTTNPARSDAGTSQNDISLTKIDRATYGALANKNSEGVPSQFWVQRFIDKTRVTLYVTPGSSQAGKYLNIYYIKRIQDAGIAHPNPQAKDGAYGFTTDVPFRFFPCLVSGLAFYLSQKINPAKTQELKLYYEDELARALAEDGSAASAFVTPQTYYPSVS